MYPIKPMKRIFTRKAFQVIFISANVLIAAWLVRYQDFAFMQSLRNLVFDQYQRLEPRESPPDMPVRIIDIDDESIRKIGQWPWPRSRVATMIDRLAELGAASIAFDMVFSEPDRTSPSTLVEDILSREGEIDPELRRKLEAIPDNDHLLAQSLSNAPTVIGFFGSTRKSAARPRETAGFVFAGEDPKKSLIFMNGAITSLPLLQNAATGVASVSLTGGRTSDVIRQVPLFITDGEQMFPTLSMEALRVATGASTFVLKTATASGETSGGTIGVVAAKVGDFVIPTTASGEIQVYYGFDDPKEYVSASQLLGDNYMSLSPLIAGNIVFIGTSAVGLSDLRVTALGQTVPGVSLHSQIIKQVLTGNYLQRPDWASGAEMAMAIAITLLMMAVLPFAGAFVSAVFGGVCAAGVLAISWYAFHEYGVLLEPIFAMLTGAVVYVLSVTLTFAATERERRFVRGAFQQYLAPTLLKKLEESPEQLVLGGEIRDITMMFMDIRNFTGISEKLSPDELVNFINRLFSPLADVIQENEGAIDKYIGDSIMAFWNAPLDVEDHQRKACKTALKMIEAVEKLNAEDGFGFRANNVDLPEIKIGVGINAGEACVGNMGSSNRFNYSVVGDTVNVAARIESETKNIGSPVVVSEATVNAVPDLAFLFVGNLMLKGKSHGVDLYALVGDEEYSQTEEFRLLKERHEELLAAASSANGEELAEAANKCRAAAPEKLAELYKKFVERNSMVAAN
jgi:adenylate cyclase